MILRRRIHKKGWLILSQRPPGKGRTVPVSPIVSPWTAERFWFPLSPKIRRFNRPYFSTDRTHHWILFECRKNALLAVSHRMMSVSQNSHSWQRMVNSRVLQKLQWHHANRCLRWSESQSESFAQSHGLRCHADTAILRQMINLKVGVFYEPECTCIALPALSMRQFHSDAFCTFSLANMLFARIFDIRTSKSS